MKIIIREIEKSEYYLLVDFLYEAIFVPDGVEAPAKSIINSPELQVYIECFGMLKDDKCLVAEVDGSIVGAIWSRIMIDYGHIDDTTPSLAISLYKAYRGLGIGKKLIKEMLILLNNNGYPCVSLAVQKANYAVKLYQDAGFKKIREVNEEYIMVKFL